MDRSLHLSTPTSPSVRRNGWMGQPSRSLVLNIFSSGIRLHSCQQPLDHSRVISGLPLPAQGPVEQGILQRGFQSGTAREGHVTSATGVCAEERQGPARGMSSMLCWMYLYFRISLLPREFMESDIKHKQMCIHAVKTKIR